MSSSTSTSSKPDQRPCSGLRVDLKRCLLQTDCCTVRKKTPLQCLQEGDVPQVRSLRFDGSYLRCC